MTVKDSDRIKYHLDKAIYEAKSGRPGPVWIDIPLDIQAAEIEPDLLEGYSAKSEERTVDVTQIIDRTAKLLQESQRPVLIAGQGIERGNGKAVFRELIEVLKIPVLFSWIAVELLEYDHICNLGKPGMVAPRYANFTMQDSDLIIAVGTRLDPSMIGYDPTDFAPNAKKVIVDIDVNELNKFEFPIEIKAQMDATEFITRLLEKVQNMELNPHLPQWLAHCNNWKKQYPVVLEEFKKDTGGVNPYFFIDILSENLSEEDVIIPGSSGAGIDVYWMCLKNKRGQRTFATGALGSMGYGLPAAIGAAVASGRRTICIEGDGSLQLNIQELASIVGMGLPIKIFVNGNKGYLSIMNMQRTHFNGRFVGANKTSHLNIPDIVAVAKAYGIAVYEIRKHEEATDVIRQILDREGPVLCYVHMRDDIPIQPKVMSRITENGTMKSGKLRNLWPFLEQISEEV